ncbi:hypothetical protein D3C86_1952410 [compost metagenome]
MQCLLGVELRPLQYGHTAYDDARRQRCIDRGECTRPIQPAMTATATAEGHRMQPQQQRLDFTSTTQLGQQRYLPRRLDDDPMPCPQCGAR